MKRIVILASGAGSNAENIIKHFKDSDLARVTYVLSNNKDAKVLIKANRLGINNLPFSKTDFSTDSMVLDLLIKEADIVILAGFLWKIPQNILKNFPNKIINIHPALLPKYGGKGMYGNHVHKAVIANKEVETGITIHYVNENYDEGAIIFQAKTSIDPSDTSDDVAAKIHVLEQNNFPKVIESVLLKMEK
ncbi:MAG: phosphoribosylglycinamide formyltransferase [Flavobacteriaceae bacterium]|nr:MAG: phosphoribosylglycinamide formyltransferase [Flavobacteriaceae bacterium]